LKKILEANTMVGVESLEMCEFLSMHREKIIWMLKTRYSLSVAFVYIGTAPGSMSLESFDLMKWEKSDSLHSEMFRACDCALFLGTKPDFVFQEG
jgi:hypothetical protein